MKDKKKADHHLKKKKKPQTKINRKTSPSKKNKVKGMENRSDALSLRYLKILIVVVPFFFGLYYEWAAFAAVVAVAGLLLLKFRENQTLILGWDRGSLAFGIGLILSIAAIFFAVDKGLAIIGVLRLIAAALFLLLSMQYKNEERVEALNTLPISGAVMLGVSLFAWIIPALKPYVSANGRLGGLFQYANTCGFFFLLCLAVLLSRKVHKKEDILLAAWLFFGIWMSGSRFVLVLSALFLLYIGIRNRTLRKPVLIGMGVMAVLAAVYLLISGNISGIGIGRFFDLTNVKSSFTGRLLYWKDGLREILSHPIGMGYLSYYYTQGSFQTGNYIVRFIHNDWFQMALDYGIPTLICCIFGLFSHIRQTETVQKRLWVLIIIAGMFDFNLMYIAIIFVLILTLNPVKVKSFSLKPKASYASVAAISIVFVYFGLSSFMSFLGNDDFAVKLYPGNTEALINVLSETQSAAMGEKLADRILKHNDAITIAWNAKAEIAVNAKDYEAMMRYKDHAIACSRYYLDGYEDYIDKLCDAGDTAKANGNITLLKSVQEKADEVVEIMAAVKRSSDGLAWQINDTPQLDLPEEYVQKIEALKAL